MGTSSASEIPWGWELWYHLDLVEIPSHFENFIWVGLLIDGLKFHGGGNFDCLTLVETSNESEVPWR